MEHTPHRTLRPHAHLSLITPSPITFIHLAEPFVQSNLQVNRELPTLLKALNLKATNPGQ